QNLSTSRTTNGNPYTMQPLAKEGTQLRSQRQNDFIIVIARHEAPGAISSEDRFVLQVAL
ncbi:MAG: hypothetical protein KAI38_03210, partial [Candidatus Latescibacteria bacterium]|nr:hypothetical protein [Candidatus Latescibacterota bacterium]